MSYLCKADMISVLCLCRSWRRWIEMGTVANTNWGTNWSKPSTWCLEAAERRRRTSWTDGPMDWWMDGWMDGGWGGRMGEGDVRAFCFSELFEQSAELLSVGPNRQPQLRPLTINPSPIYASVDRLIDLRTEWLTGWDPDYLRLVGFGAENQFPNRFGYIYNSTSVWSRFRGKMEPSWWICRFGFGFKLTAGSSRDQNEGAWLWRRGWRLSQVSPNNGCGSIDLTSGLTAGLELWRCCIEEQKVKSSSKAADSFWSEGSRNEADGQRVRLEPHVVRMNPGWISKGHVEAQQPRKPVCWCRYLGPRLESFALYRRIHCKKFRSSFKEGSVKANPEQVCKGFRRLFQALTKETKTKKLMSQKLMTWLFPEVGASWRKTWNLTWPQTVRASAGSRRFKVAVLNNHSMFSLDNHSVPQHTEPDAYWPTRTCVH